MKKMKKLLAVALAAIIALSVLAVAPVSASAAGDGNGEAVGDGSTIYFKVGNSGWRNYEFITIFIYEKNSGDMLITWGSKKGRMEDMGDGATYSFDLAAAGITLDSGKNYACSFTADWKQETCDLMISRACYGDTAVAQAEKIENYVDSNKKSNKVRWTHTTSHGIPKCITSIGNVIGDTFWPDENAYDMLVHFLKSPGRDGFEIVKRFRSEMTDQQLIDSVGSELGLGQDDIAKAVAEAKRSGVDINYSSSTGGSSVPAQASTTRPGTPVITSVTYNGSSNTVSWSKTGNATCYRVASKKTGDSGYRYYITTSRSFTENNVTGGVQYAYQVQAINDGVEGSYSSTRTIYTLLKPNLTLSNKSNGIRAEWQKIPGATKYRVFYKSELQSSWSYTDTLNEYFPLLNTVQNRKYAFQVLPIYSGGNGNYSDVKNIIYKAPGTDVKPTLTLSNKSNGIRAEWNKIPGAKKYRVYYKSELQSGWSYTDTLNEYYPLLNTVNNRKYAFQIYAEYAGGGGVYSDVKNITFNVPYGNVRPTLTVSNKTNGIRAEWNYFPGAIYYTVYYREYNSKTWSSVTTKNTYYPLLNVQTGKAYCFQVQPVFSMGSGAYSDVKTIIFNDVTKVKPMVTVNTRWNGIAVAWDAVPGATGYRVFYRKSSESNWKSADTQNTYYAYLNVENYREYAFQVQALFSGQGGAYSSVMYIEFCPAEDYGTAISASKSSSGVTVKWNPVSGAKGYRIWYYDEDNDYDDEFDIYSTSITSYFFTSDQLDKGHYYIFSVCPIFNNSYWGDYEGEWSAEEMVYFN